MNNRRKLLLALSGAFAATVWKNPVVSAVVIPANAQTSGGAVLCGEGWINGDSDGFDDERLGDTDTRCECEELVLSERPEANGATWGFDSSRSSYRRCFAEFGWVCPSTSSTNWETKSFEGIDCTD